MSAFCDVIRRSCTKRLCVFIPANMAEVARACSSRSAAGPSTGETPRRQLGRKRVRHEEEWQQAAQKMKRNSGQEYVTKKKKTKSYS